MSGTKVRERRHFQAHPAPDFSIRMVEGERAFQIEVEVTLRKLSEGVSEADLIDAYPRLTREEKLRRAFEGMGCRPIVPVITTQLHALST